LYGSGSFNKKAKKFKNTLISKVLCLLKNFFSLKKDTNVPTGSTVISKKIFVGRKPLKKRAGSGSVSKRHGSGTLIVRHYLSLFPKHPCL
jgi:hypothetical protein